MPTITTRKKKPIFKQLNATGNNPVADAIDHK